MNPFTLNYHSEYFCDRENEVKVLKENSLNGLNTLVHSPRRLGKSAIIHHLFYQLEKEKKIETLYVDLFASQNLNDFAQIFGENLLNRYHKKNLVSGIKKLFKGLYASISFSADGSHMLNLGIGEGQMETSLNQLFNYLENRKKPVIVAFDEFQEIASYPKKAEAVIRTITQRLNNVHFIYSGSSFHMLQHMFYSAKQAFYQSSESLIVGKISEEKYKEFIITNFEKFKKRISDDAIDHLLTFTDRYTYYTQVICNLAFYKTNKSLEFNEAILLTNNYMETRKADYSGILRLLSDNQQKVIIAIAKDGEVSKPTAVDFLMRNKLPSGSSTLQALNALLEKEMIYKSENGYVVYDVFFRRFLDRYY